MNERKFQFSLTEEQATEIFYCLEDKIEDLKEAVKNRDFGILDETQLKRWIADLETIREEFALYA
jgi:hypothetical protein